MTIREVYEAVLVELNIEGAQSFTVEEFNYIANKSLLSFVNSRYNYYASNQQLSDDLRVFLKSQTFNISDNDVVIDPGAAVAVPTYNAISSHVTALVSTSATVLLVSSVKDIQAKSNIRINGDLYTIDTVQTSTIELESFTTNDIMAGTVIEVETPVVDTNSDYSDGRTLEINLPSSDYLHLLSCRTLWKIKRQDITNTVNCDAFEVGYINFPTKRLTFDMYNAIENNTYLKPASNRPYHQVFDNNKNSGLINFPATLSEYGAYQNKPRIKVLFGKANAFLEIVGVEIEYIKIPELVTLLDSDVYTADIDNSQVLELPDYLLNEVVKRCTAFFLEKSGNPRMQTQPIFNQDIPAIPTNMGIPNPGAAALSQQDNSSGQD